MSERINQGRKETRFEIDFEDLIHRAKSMKKEVEIEKQNSTLYGSMAAGGIASSRRGGRKGLGEQTPLDCVEGEGQKPEGEENNVGSVGDKDEE